MKAVVFNRFGASDVLEIKTDLSVPEPADNQVLINVKAAGINPLDWKIRHGMLKPVLGSKFPMIPGNEASGIIVKCGKKVKDFKAGDRVYCMTDSNRMPAYSAFARPGASAEYTLTREDTLALMPENLSFEEAASVPLCALTAWQILFKKTKIEKGTRILINGASGGVGTYAVQIAKFAGADVAAVCSGGKSGLVKSLGADRVIDYRKENFLLSEEKYDVIYDVAAQSSWRKCRHVMTEKGIYVSNIAPLFVFVFPFLRKCSFSKRRAFAWVDASGKDLQKISELIKAEQIKPVVDGVYLMDDVKAAHDYSESGKSTGKTVLKIQ